MSIKKLCKGDGECLMQTNSEDEYAKNPEYVCEHNCVLIECPNYVLCNNKGPQWVLSCSNGICIDCDLTFGTWKGGKGILETKLDIECCVCLEEHCLGISLPKCVHFICVICMKKRYFPKHNPVFPKFPYPELEDEYDDDPDNEKWTMYPLILQYQRIWNTVETSMKGNMKEMKN